MQIIAISNIIVCSGYLCALTNCWLRLPALVVRRGKYCAQAEAWPVVCAADGRKGS